MLGQNRWAPPTPQVHADPLSAVLAGGASWVPIVHSTLADGDPVHVPVTGGRVVFSTSLAAQVQVSITVPRFADGRDWLPGADAAHPLARYGQSLSVAVEVKAGSVEEVVQVATVYIDSWDLGDDGTVSVEAFGPLHRIEAWKFVVPQAVRGNGTFHTEMRRLVDGIAPLVIDDALVGRAAPAGMAWGDERLSSMVELADAWPARIRTDAYGVVWVLPPLGDVPQPQARLADGEGGTVVSVPVSDTRQGMFNRVVARGEAASEDRPAVQGWAQVREGPMSVHGPYGMVTQHFSSPLLQTPAQCRNAANTRLARLTAKARTLAVTCAPDPRVSLDLAVEVVHDGRRDWGWVTGFELPLVVGSGAMRLDVEVPA